MQDTMPSTKMIPPIQTWVGFTRARAVIGVQGKRNASKTHDPLEKGSEFFFLILTLLSKIYIWNMWNYILSIHRFFQIFWIQQCSLTYSYVDGSLFIHY